MKAVNERLGPADEGPVEETQKVRGMKEYERIKSRYLSLCRRYGLNPFDLNILSMAVARMPKRDKTAIVRLILALIRMERSLDKRIIHGLFPLTVEESEKSGYLIPTNREA